MLSKLLVNKAIKFISALQQCLKIKNQSQYFMTIFRNFKNQLQFFMTIFRNFKNQSAFYNHIWYHSSCQYKTVWLFSRASSAH